MLRWVILKLRMAKMPKLMIDIDSKHNFYAKNKVNAEDNVDAEDNIDAEYDEDDDDCNNGSASSRLPKEIGHPSIPM